jgi:hypothetical protein
MITNAKYIAITDLAGNKSNSTIKATLNGVEVFVPINENNRDYQEILKWVDAGNTIEEAD